MLALKYSVVPTHAGMTQGSSLSETPMVGEALLLAGAVFWVGWEQLRFVGRSGHPLRVFTHLGG